MNLFFSNYYVNSYICVTIGVKRIMQEAKELAKETAYEFDAHPLEVNFCSHLNFALDALRC